MAAHQAPSSLGFSRKEYNQGANLICNLVPLPIGQKGSQTSPSYRKSALNIHWQDWCWCSNTLATWCEEPTHWKRPWWWERLRAGVGGNRGWDGWKASWIQRTWTWANWKMVRDREAWHAVVHGVAKNQTELSDWTTTTTEPETSEHFPSSLPRQNTLEL